ncbi:hypothetical protein DERF_011337, partial [Dermatophagoides farinae]
MIIFDLNMMIMVMIWLTLIHTYTLVKQVFTDLKWIPNFVLISNDNSEKTISFARKMK